LSNEEKTNDYENFEKGMIYMKIKIKKKQRKKKLITAIEWDYGILPPSSIKGLPTDKNV
jgi:hypothetical protein